MSDQPHAEQAAARSRLYQLFAMLFVYPDDDWVAAIRAGEVANRMAELCGALDIAEPLQPDGAALADAGAADEANDDLAVEYTRLFDTGPISLYGGHNHGTRMQVMEEVLRFHDHFGLAPNPQQNELPDHLVSELEFMHYLCYQEAQATDATEEMAAPYRRAQRDFLERHLGRWATQLHERLVEQQALPFFSEATRLLSAFLVEEMQRLEIAAPAPRTAHATHTIQAI